jgi:DNA-binding NarL/FixJ family response regulator
VLVIDDSEIARDHIQRLLSEAGLRVLTMASPIGATRTVLNDNVDVVVIDVLMPGMRGDKLAALFKSNPRFRNLGVVLVSGEDPAELSRLMKETRASAVVSKSDVRGIVGAVRSVLRQRPPVGGAGG